MLILSLLILAAACHCAALRPNRGVRGRFAAVTAVERFGVYVLLGLAALLVLAGCAKPPPARVPPAQRIEADTRSQAAGIGQFVDAARVHLESAHARVRSQITVVESGGTADPVELRAASGDLTRAAVALEPVGPATRAIAALATEGRTLTENEAGRADENKRKLDEERSKFFSYQQRVLFYSLVAFAVVALGILMLIRAFGGAVVVEVVSDILRGVWRAAKAVLLFPLWIIDQLNQKYDAKEGAKKS